MSNHSPGPWRADGPYVVDADGNTIHQQHWSQSGEPEMDGRGDTDARLIAAAPTLLAMLKRARMDDGEWVGDADDLIDSIENP